jgi:type I restriction enzyme, S subunit
MNRNLVKLGSVCKLQNGFAFKSSKFKDFGESILRITNIKNNVIDENKIVFFNPNDYKENLERFKVQKNDLLIAMSGATTGKLGFNRLDKTFYLNQRVGKLIPSSELEKKFLFYQLSTKIEENLKISQGAAQPNLSAQQINDIEIYLPPLSEQKRIVTKLDKAFTEIGKAEAAWTRQEINISALYERLVNIRFEKKDGYINKKLSEVCEKITDGTHQTPKYYDSGYIFLSSKNVTKRLIDWDNVRYIDEKQHLEMQKRISPKIGDILLAKNGTTGIAAMVDKDVIFDIYVSLAWLRSKGEVLPEYLLEFINSKNARDQFSKRTKGIGVQNLHLQEIREVIIPFPKNKHEQISVINYLKKIDKSIRFLKEINKNKLQKITLLKSAIIKKELQSEAA